MVAAVSCCAAALAGCGAGPPAAAEGRHSADLAAWVTAGRYSVDSSDEAAAGALRFAAEPGLDWASEGRENRAVVRTSGAGWSWRTRIPPRGRLRGAVRRPPPAADEVAGEGSDRPAEPAGGVQATLSVVDGTAEEILEVVRLPAVGEWRELDLDLAVWAGRQVTLAFEARSWDERANGGASAAPPTELEWSALRVARSATAGPAPSAESESGGPNLLFVVVDTLRRDRVSAYGDARPTTPQIRSWLADAGVTFERAYAQAAWTVPSVASYLTGRYPDRAMTRSTQGPVLGSHATTLAQVLHDEGYRTAAIAANPVLQPLGGFGRGFESYAVVGVDEGWEALRAEEMTDRALDWLNRYGDERFFLYLHYVDPHSPYSPPAPDEEPVTDAAGFNLSQADDLRWGRAELADPETDLPRVEELYDQEVRSVDAAVARLLAGLSPRQLADTLIVFTSDHGEELLDHGWWGHRRAVYDEIVRIPLLMRWDGHLPAGRRVAGTVRLLDLFPTLVEACRADPPSRLDGQSLWPHLIAGEEPPRLAADVSEIFWGVERAAAIRDGLKLLLYNRSSPGDGSGARFDFAVSLDRRLMERIEIYDLEADPGETRNLAVDGGLPAYARETRAMAELLHRRLGEQIEGLRLVARDLPAGSRLTAQLHCEPEPERAMAYFLDDDDRVSVCGNRIEIDLVADRLAKGAVIAEGCDRLEVLSAELSGGAALAAPLAVRVGGRPRVVGAVERARSVLDVPWPTAAGGPVLDVWHTPAERRDPVPISDEALKRLLALGYAAP